jgi:hypothetical protein
VCPLRPAREAHRLCDRPDGDRENQGPPRPQQLRGGKAAPGSARGALRGRARGQPGARAADASFFRRDSAEARELYERALASERNWAALREIYLKLADLAYLAGDPATEPRLREHYFGILRE